ncbi:hypothetical protein DU508_06945 [Pedobacter chinensis]|uniref:Uncharacterized protein n=1 Tax=Pedobacter chinensis TaxID=2282421 RepID=A0A369PW77_9SPHI|nr:hypothetical protein [Pedobacter chinensis]RDC56931.1 hypothetical protein DU508_06945 [Pedobacter chinensis]
MGLRKVRNNTQKRDSVLLLYKNQSNKIKNSPEIYLNYINYALKNKKTQLSNESSPYKYISGLLSTYDKNSHFIKEIDLYRLIKYYLFKRNDELLPESFRGLPMVEEKNYIKQYTPKCGERRATIKFLKKNLSLTSAQLKFIKNRYNIKDITDMKKYLNENGLSSENKEFIEWAIDYLIKRSWVSVGWLENVYKTGRQNNIPSDREP